MSDLLMSQSRLGLVGGKVIGDAFSGVCKRGRKRAKKKVCSLGEKIWEEKSKLFI